MKKIIAFAASAILAVVLLFGCAPIEEEKNVTETTLAASASQSVNRATAAELTIEQAKEIALQNAGLTETQVTFTKTRKELDDGAWAFEIEFTADGWEYDYTILCADGRILDSEKERLRGGVTQPDGSKPIAAQTTAAPSAQKTTAKPKTTANANANISLDEAKNIALKNAGVKIEDVTFQKARLERDDGVWQYEIDFVANGYEYDYEIHAGTGYILEHETEVQEQRRSQVPSTHSAATDISLEQAKATALKHAGLSASQVTFIKAKLDYDDGIQEYEIEFTYNGWEYEYTIHAGTGAVLEFDKDRWND